MQNDPYKILGVSEQSTLSEIKRAYRCLAKKYHPDIGGDKQKILEINSAWEILREIKRQERDKKDREKYTQVYNKNIEKAKTKSSTQDKEITLWIKLVYSPIDKLMAEIINSFSQRLKDLSADQYDDVLMNSFCQYIEISKRKITKARQIYQSIATPMQAKQLSLGLYQYFSEIEDGINEWERYTMGYVENYLHDGNEMLREAKKKRSILQKEKRFFSMQ